MINILLNTFFLHMFGLNLRCDIKTVMLKLMMLMLTCMIIFFMHVICKLSIIQDISIFSCIFMDYNAFFMIYVIKLTFFKNILMCIILSWKNDDKDFHNRDVQTCVLMLKIAKFFWLMWIIWMLMWKYEYMIFKKLCL